MFKIFILLLVLPIAELYTISHIYGVFSHYYGGMAAVFFTIALFLTIALAGLAFAKLQGLQVFFKIQDRIRRGQLPTPELISGLMVLIGAALLVLPGFVSDMMAFTFLIPWTRKFWQKFFAKRFARQASQTRIFMQFPGTQPFSAGRRHLNHDMPHGQEVIDV